MWRPGVCVCDCTGAVVAAGAQADRPCLLTGLGEERSPPTEDAAGDGMSRVAPPADPAPAAQTAGPGTSAAAPAAEGQPVPPPRKHSVRSRADGLRDALQDLSPVKGQRHPAGPLVVQRLGMPCRTSACQKSEFVQRYVLNDRSPCPQV